MLGFKMPKKTRPVKGRESNEEFLAARVRGGGPPQPIPTEGALAAVLDNVRETDGAEIPRSLWPEAEVLVARGLITLGAPRGPSSNWRRAELVPEKLTTAQDVLAFVEQLALCWVAEGPRGDEPGSAKEAYELLIKHGYTPNSTRTLLYRSDGSEVMR